jgi:c(7)-type cytochrome triheme protein
MANGEWQMAKGKAQSAKGKTQEDGRQKTVMSLWPAVNGLRSSVLGLRSFLLVFASLFLAGLLFGVALAVEGDIVFKQSEGGAIAPAVFPHWVHRIRYKCYACHPALFEMKAGANKITMEAVQDGKFCGACHNGQIAWGITFESCNKCHIGK